MINLRMMVMTSVMRMMILLMMVTMGIMMMGIMQVVGTVMMTVKVYLKMGGSGEPEQLKGHILVSIPHCA